MQTYNLHRFGNPIYRVYLNAVKMSQGRIGLGSFYQDQGEKDMHYSTIKNCDIANGAGVRVSLFVSGCTNHCKNCFQPQTWDFDYGEEFTEETEQKLIDMLKPSYIRGLTLLGGEPMEPENQRGLLPFVKRFKGTYPDKDIWCFTGFTYETLKSKGSHPHCESTDELLSYIDVLVDGRFIEELKSPALRFRGSSNQRLIDLKKTLESNEVVLLPNHDRIKNM